MKYEYLCGYESDFFTMPENVIAVVRLDHCVQGLTEFNQITELGKPVLAMRRIIAEPKREEDEFVSLVESEYNKMPNEISFRAGIRAAYRKLKGG